MRSEKRLFRASVGDPQPRIARRPPESVVGVARPFESALADHAGRREVISEIWIEFLRAKGCALYGARDRRGRSRLASSGTAVAELVYCAGQMVERVGMQALFFAPLIVCNSDR